MQLPDNWPMCKRSVRLLPAGHILAFAFQRPCIPLRPCGTPVIRPGIIRPSVPLCDVLALPIDKANIRADQMLRGDFTPLQTWLNRAFLPAV